MSESIQEQIARATQNFPASAEVVALGTVAPVVAAVVEVAAPLVVAPAVAVVGAVDASAAPQTATVVSLPEQAPAPVLTRSEQLAKEIEAIEGTIKSLTTKLETKKLQLGSVDLIASVTEGAVIKVKLGRAETTREVDGTVTGVKTEASGTKKFKVLVGTGFDATTEVINESQIISVVR